MREWAHVHQVGDDGAYQARCEHCDGKTGPVRKKPVAGVSAWLQAEQDAMWHDYENHAPGQSRAEATL